MNKKAFTLIELLVVVLIIAILASIALPKYMVAKEKTHAVSAMTRLKSVAEALDRYKLAIGSYPSTISNWSALDIEMPEGCSDTGYCTGDIWQWYIYANSGRVLAHRDPRTKYYIIYSQTNKYFTCYVYGAGSNTDFYEKVCKSLCGTDLTSGTNPYCVI